MRAFATGAGLAVGGLLAGAAAWAALAAAMSPAPPRLIRSALAAACATPPPGIDRMAALLDATSSAETPLRLRGPVRGWRRRFGLPSGGRVEVERLEAAGGAARLSITYSAPSPRGPRPFLTAMAGADCRIRLARRLLYGDDGRAKVLEHLGTDLRPSGAREPLDPPLPAAPAPAPSRGRGVRVALVDSGVNYLISALAARLARDARGRPLGYDFWDLDPRPFDANPARSPFFPQRHGTRTASVLLREAPQARLVSYRYPRPDMGRMADLIERAAAHRVFIVGLPLGGNRRRAWDAFARAAAAHPEILFIASAGNNGRNIDARPVYPAALPLDNMITVTSAAPSGRLAPGANWGPRSVDLMTPAENVPVIDFRGRPARASGSSFAVPRIAALAARLLAAHPRWRAPEMRRAILARARHTPETRGLVAHGLIADPAAE